MKGQLPAGGVTTLLGCGLMLAFAGGCASSRVPATANLTLSPQDRNEVRALAHYAQGLIYEDTDARFSKRVLEEYARAAELAPGHHRLNAKAATGYLLNGHPDAAITLLERSCRELPNSWLARIDLATAYQFVGNLDAAIRAFQLAARLEPDRVPVFMTIANLQFDAGADTDALKTLDEALRSGAERNNVRAMAYSRGLRLIEENKADRALLCFRFVVRNTENQRGQIYSLIGDMFESLKLIDQARQCYTWATQERPPLPQAFVKLAMLEFDTNPETAIHILDNAHAALPDDVLIPLAKGQILSSQGRYSEAIPAYTLVADLHKRQPELNVPTVFYLYYGAAYERSGDYTRAEQVFEECLRRYPDTHEVQNYLAYMWAERDVNLQRAFDLITQALQHAPENGAYLDTLGWVYFRLGNFQEALKAIQSAAQFEPDDPTITAHLGDVWSALGNRAQAIQYWRESYHLDDQNAAVAAKLEAHGVDLKAILHETAIEARTPAPAGMP
ncbi:MAG: tetratricopeptide repeat protein [Verrucomicrobia bacterium]|nr:tetratricopeptide repeat protein [Verrucomicrobiota bacterium]